MKLFIVTALMVASLVASSCTTTTGPTNSTNSSENLRLAFVTNNTSDFWTIARKGTEKADAEFDDVSVEFRLPADGTAAEQKRLLDDLLAKGVDGIAGLWSYNGPAIVNAVREAGKVGQVKIIAFDEEDETLTGVKQGAIYATVVQQPFEFGYQAIKLMRQFLKNDKSAVPPNKQIFIPTVVVKQDNVDEFTNQINQLRGRST